MWVLMWGEVIVRIGGEFRWIALDAPGTGESAPVPASAMRLENSARAVNGLIEGLELENLTLVVHDLGGPAGLAGGGRGPGGGWGGGRPTAVLGGRAARRALAGRPPRRVERSAAPVGVRRGVH